MYTLLLSIPKGFGLATESHVNESSESCPLLQFFLACEVAF